MNGISIEIKNLSKKFGELSILEDANISIDPGDFFAIVGKSGCGKSTLLRLIKKKKKPTSGSILLDGKPVDRINSDVRFVFQDARILLWKNVLDNVILGSPTRSREDALWALKAVGLEGREKSWPIVLSGGQRQRLSLARAIVGKPKVLLLDEPLGALDALTRIEMQQLIEKLWKEQRFTAVLVTHDVAEAVTLANHVIVMDNKKIHKDIHVELARPREHNRDFAYYEEKILKYILKPKDTKGAEYVI